jgi:hypothetical protein
MNNRDKINTSFKKIVGLLIYILIIQNISAYTWKPVVVPAGGAIQDVVYSQVSQGLIYLRTDMGGAYRWDNTNSVWIPLTDWLGDWNLYGIESIAPDPKNANVVYAAIGQSYNSTNGYLIVSSDQGSTWTQYPMPVIIAGNDSGNFAGERLAVDPDNTSILYYGSRSGGLWKSTNSGANWSRVTSFPVNGDAGHGLAYVIFDPNSATGSGCNTIYVGVRALNSGNSNIYRSTNAGANWSVISGGPSGMTTCQASLGTDRNLWIVYNNDNSSPTAGQIWKLNTSTLAWSNVTPSNGPPSGAGGYSGICVDRQNSQHVVVSTWCWWGGTDKCFQTTNGGTSWTIIANAQNSWNSGPYPVYDINGANWTRFCSPYNGGAWFIACVKIDPFNSNNAVYTTGGGLWTTKNVLASTQPQGITWTFTDYGIEQTAVLFLCPSYKSGVFFSCLGDISGMRYTNLDSPAPDKYCNPAFGNTNCLDFAENNPNIVVRVGHSGSVASDTAFSSDNGQNWTSGATAPPGYGTPNQMRSCAVAADGSRVIVCPNNGYGNPAYTTNSGASWTTCNGLPSGSDLASDRVNASVFFATNGSNLYRSTDGGANFSVVNSFSGNGAPRTVFGLTGEVWVATGSGLYRFTNNGATVTKISNVNSANSVGFGKAAPGQSHPAVYLTGNVSGIYGFYRCDDGVGTSWVRLNDNNHQYGYGAWCAGDQVVYGRMYVGTNGRGTLYCDSNEATPTNTPYAGTPTFTPTRTRTPTNTPYFSPTITSTIPPYTLIYDGDTTGSRLADGTVGNGSPGTMTEAAVGKSGNGMRLTYTSISGWWQEHSWDKTANVNIGSNLYLVFDVRQDASSPGGVNQFLIRINWTGSSVNVANYLVEGGVIDTTWKTARIPLSDILVAGQTQIDYINFIANWNADYTVDVDNIRLEASAPTSTNTPGASPTFTRTVTITSTRTATPTYTRTLTSTFTRSATATSTPSRTNTGTATRTNSPSATSSPTQTSTSATNTYTRTPTRTGTPTWTRTATGTYTGTATRTNTPSTSTYTGTATNTGSPTYSRTSTPINTLIITNTFTGTATRTNTAVITNTWTGTPTRTVTPTYSRTMTGTVTNTATRTVTSSQVPSFTRTITVTNTQVESATRTLTQTLTYTRTNTLTNTPISTLTRTSTSTPTFSQTATSSQQSTMTSTPTFTQTSTSSQQLTMTWTQTRTATPTYTRTLTNTPTVSASPTWTITQTHSVSPTITQTSTGTPPTSTNTPTVTPSSTVTQTYTWTSTRTGTPTSTGTNTPADTETYTRTATGTLTRTLTLTQTSTLTSTPTYTRTLTPTYTYTFTRTTTPTLTYTRTFTPTYTRTSTPTSTNTPVNTATFTPTITPTAQEIKDVKPCPNPYNPIKEPELRIYFKISQQDIEKIVIRIYTSGYRLIKVVKREGTEAIDAATQGYINIEAKELIMLANSTYYFYIKTEKKGESCRSKINKMVILK